MKQRNVFKKMFKAADFFGMCRDFQRLPLAEVFSDPRILHLALSTLGKKRAVKVLNKIHDEICRQIKEIAPMESSVLPEQRKLSLKLDEVKKLLQWVNEGYHHV